MENGNENVLKGLESMMFSFRLLRNLCANGTEFQNKQRQENNHELGMKYLLLLANHVKILRREFDESDLKTWWSEQALVTMRAGGQFLCNFVTGNEINQSSFWESFFPSSVKEFVSKVNYRPFLEPLFAAVHNSVASSKERLESICSEGDNAELFGMILNTMVVNKSVAEDGAFQWVFLIISKLLSSGLFPRAFKNLSSVHESTTDSRVILLKNVDAIIHNAPSEDQPKVLDEETCVILAEELRNLSEKSLVSDKPKKVEDKSEEDVSSVFEDEDFVKLKISSNDLELVFVLIQIFGLISVSRDDDKASWVSDILLNNGIVEIISRYLREDYKAEQEHMKNGGKQGALDRGGLSFGFKRDLITILANISYKHKGVQDKARELDIFPMLLSNCKIDEKNPYIKEWSILALRNLLDQNHDNQAAVEAIKLQGPAPSKELEDMGLKAEIEGGKLKITPVDL
eukprot:TRINITY_DN4840_c0_g2_i1.p1 TRINITY_DN4840_c0_g2~~TRINITY_DN4840_c0_g2_i1.p1  ORF type:complete len:532 (-),score=164.81 TRINITY_DN4840_c0_g2_i1:835-2208(-)